jgi:hypothetical protein
VRTPAAPVSNPSAARRAKAYEKLAAGFKKIWNLKGGITAWADEIDRSMPMY